LDPIIDLSINFFFFLKKNYRYISIILYAKKKFDQHAA